MSVECYIQNETYGLKLWDARCDICGHADDAGASGDRTTMISRLTAKGWCFEPRTLCHECRVEILKSAIS